MARPWAVRPVAHDRRHAVDGGLDRKSDLAFHFRGRHAVGFGDDRDRRRGEIREHINRHPDGCINAKDSEERGRDQNEQAVGKRPLNKFRHGSSSVSVAVSGDHPRN